MSKPFDTKFVVQSLDDDGAIFELFNSYAEAEAHVRDILIPRAEKESGDLEGHYPDWVDDLLICQIQADVVSTPDGLKVAKRV